MDRKIFLNTSEPFNIVIRILATKLEAWADIHRSKQLLSGCRDYAGFSFLSLLNRMIIRVTFLFKKNLTKGIPPIVLG